jgi:N-acetylneuraminate synthase
MIRKPAVIIAEIGCNHKGEPDIARELIETAKLCGADFAKFQKRNPRELLTPEEYDAPHPVPYNAYGETYGAHREFLEFTVDQHCALKEHCEAIGIGYACSVWDLMSAREIAALNPEHIKVPSATNTNQNVMRYLCDEYGGSVHASVGMTTHAEEEAVVKLFEGRGRADALVLYACTSGYPVSFDDVCLLEIVRLKETYGDRVGGIGFSGHHLGIAVDVAAFVLGAEYIERHFTLDRTWKGTDHAASLEPDGLRRLARDIKASSKALRYKASEVLDVEKVQRRKLKWTTDKGK